MNTPTSYHLVDPVKASILLRSTATKITDNEILSDEIQHLIDGMLRLAAGKGHSKEDSRQMVGLAAPQVGVSKRLLLIDLTASGANQQQTLVEVINPILSECSTDKVDGREGCWSCGDVCGNVSRHSSVTLSGLNRHSKPVTYRLEGFVARIAQHETDHLNGIRFPDRISLDEPWRLHRVTPAEFEAYRSKWQEWPHLYERAKWEALRDGTAHRTI